MASDLHKFPLWERTLEPADDGFNTQRETLRVALIEFRNRTRDLVSAISHELPGLTVHDITHLDALWRVAGEIAGPDYPINPAEAFVLGGAFLLHDSAHVVAAYPNGIDGIKKSLTWQDYVAQAFGGAEPASGSSEEKRALFHVLRQLHAARAENLLEQSWNHPSSDKPIFLLESEKLKDYYGHLIGHIAASHHWSAHHVARVFRDRFLPAPAFLQPATWKVDALKIAFLLRTADAAHVDALRAPWFLFALRQPKGVSEQHWRFQSKLGQPSTNDDHQLQLTSGAPFTAKERKSWWLAYDTARMIDRELRDAYRILSDENRAPFKARSVLGSESPEAFARNVLVQGWEPVNTTPLIGDVPGLISKLGGTALYGNNPSAALRELLQNACDAVRAYEKIAGGSAEGMRVRTTVERSSTDEWLLSVADTGIGMSRHVLTSVLLDFGNSLWASDLLREELPGLAKSGFAAGGKFGIGFYSVFMLGSEVSVISRRFEQAPKDNADQWNLIFDDGVAERPILTRPTSTDRLISHGTRVSVKLSSKSLAKLLSTIEELSTEDLAEHGSQRFAGLVAHLAPASPLTITTRFLDDPEVTSVAANDWLNLPENELCERLGTSPSSLCELTNAHNRVLGRLGVQPRYGWRSQNATTVVHGIRSGSIRGLIGIARTEGNNLDARRMESHVSGSLEDWRRWATLVLRSSQSPNLFRNLSLHPLLPEVDIPVWTRDGEIHELGELKKWIAARTEFLVHRGEVSHDDDIDEVKSSKFDDYFQILPELVLAPVGILTRPPNGDRSNAPFPWFLPVKQMNYLAMLRLAIEEAWGQFEEHEEDDTPVGDVLGEDILRPVTRFTR